MRELKKQLRDEIWELIKEQAVKGSIVVSEIPQILRERLGVEWKDFVDYSGPGACKKWLCDEFALKEDSNNKYCLLLDVIGKSRLDKQTRKKIEGILTANFNAEGYIVNSTIPLMLRAYGIEWKKLSDGEGFEEWIEKEFPMFWIDKKGKAPCIRRHVAMKEEQEEYTAELYPINIDIESADSISQVKEMHQFAFMGWWSNTSKLLRNMTGFKGNEENVWRGIIARNLAVAKLNVDGHSYFEALDDETPKIAFNTGLKTVTGKTIYGILCENSRENCSSQWMLSCFCYPGQIGEGQWLSRRFSIPSEDKSNYEQMYHVMVDQIKNLKETHAFLVNGMDALNQIIADGKIMNGEIVKQINNYYTIWNEVLRCMEIINPADIALEDDLKLERLNTYISGNEAYHEMLGQAVSRFGIMAKELYDCLTARHLISGCMDTTAMYLDANVIAGTYSGKSSTTMNFSIFFKILDYYKALKFIADHGLNDKVMDDSEKVSKHFNIPLRAIGMYLLDTGPITALDHIAVIDEILNRCIISDEKQGINNLQDKCEIEQLDNNMLSKTVKSVFSEEGISKEALRQYFITENEFETCIITNQMKQAVKICSDSEKMLSMGYFQEEIDRINSVFLYKKEMPGSLKEYFCACRLLKIQENKNRQAEKYLLLADKTNETIIKLLDIYRREERIEDFLFVYEKYCQDYNIDFVNKSFLVQIYSKCMMRDKLLALIADHPEVSYDDENLSHIIQALEESAQEQHLVELFADRKNLFEIQPVMNEFEEALVNFDQEQIIRRANDTRLLSELGYSAEEQNNIYQSLMLGDYPEQTGSSWEFETGCRIYVFQKNKHMLAEQYLWKGLNQSNLSLQCLKLFAILSEECRWNECISLYESYENKLMAVESARKYYITAIIHTDIERVCGMIDSNLMDFLDDEVFRLLQQSGNDERSKTLIRQIQEILKRIDNDYISSVVYIRPELREFIVHPERMEEYGIFSDEADKIVNLYKNDMFSYGTSSLEIAKRVFAFWKNRNNLAEMFAAMAQPKTEAAVFLMHIFDEVQDYDKLADIFEQTSDLVENYPLDYLKTLFFKEDYYKFLDLYEQIDNVARTPLLKVEAFICSLVLERDCSGERDEKLFDLDKDIIKSYPWLMIRFMSLLTEKKKYDIYEELLTNYFDKVINNYETDMITAFITGNENLGQEELLFIQQNCEQIGKNDIVIYLYNVLGIGDQSSLADEFYCKRREEIYEMEDSEKLLCIHYLDKLYPSRHSELYRLEVSCRLENILLSDRADLEKKQMVIAILQELEIDEVLFEEIVNRFEQTAYLDFPAVCQELYNACQTTDCAVEKTLELFSRHAIKLWNQNKLDSSYCKFVCKIYIEAILGNGLPDHICSDAIFICRKYMEEVENSEAAFCLYKLYQHRGDMKMSELAFQYIMDVSPSELSVEIYEQVSEDVKSNDGAVTTRLLNIFKKELENRKADEVMDFIDEVKCFIHLNQSAVEFSGRVEKENNDTVYSEEESEYLLKILFRNSTSPQLWARCINLPFKSDPELYAKILYNIAKNGAGSWQDCVKYCEKYELKDLMFESLYCWLGSEQERGDIIECQKFLMYLESSTDYLQEFDNKIMMQGIVERLCKTYDIPDMSNEMSHEAMRSIAVVAVASGMEEILYNCFSDILATKESYVATVVISSLLLKGRIPYAYKLLQKMTVNINNCPFKPLMTQLANLSEEELEIEIKGNVIQNILQLSLPKGNRPNVDSVQNFILEALLEKKTEEAAKTLNYFLGVFKDDIVYYSGLFLLCKEPFPAYELYLQKGLYGLALLSETTSKTITIYQPKDRSYKKWFCIATAIVIQKYGNTLLEDFRADEPIANYYSRHNPAASINEIAEMNDYYNWIKSLFDNRSEDERSLLYEIMLSCITGNWKKVLQDIYENNEDPTPYEAFFKISNDGIVRSIFRIFREYSGEKRKEFRKWLNIAIKKWLPNLQERVQLICDRELLCDKEGIAQFRDIDLYLSYPFEEQFIYKILYEKVVKNADTETLFDAYLTAGVLSKNSELAKQCFEAAAESFNIGNDARAYDLYRVSYMLAYRLGLYHINKQQSYPFLRIQYQCRAAISGCFANKKMFLTRIGSETLERPECTNVILQLLCSTRANEIDRLKQYMSAKSRNMCDAIVICVSQKLTDDYKIEIAKDTKDLFERYILFQILTFRNRGMLCYLKSGSKYEMVKQMMEELVVQINNNENFRDGKPRYILNIPAFAHSSVYEQKELSAFLDNVREQPSVVTEKNMPLFIQKLEQNYANTEADVPYNILREEYDRIPLEDRSTRKEYSEKLYMSAKRNGCSLEVLDNLVIQVGRDRYQLDLDTDVLFETARYTMHMNHDSQGYNIFVNLGSSALFNVLIEYRQITDLVNSYKNNKEAYQILCETLDSDLAKEIVGGFYLVIDELVSIYSSAVVSNNIALQEQLKLAYRKFEDIEYSREWFKIKNHLQMLIMIEINNLCRCPILVCEVLNQGVNTANGRIYGQISNVGRERAESIELQAIINKDIHTANYHLNMLYPENKAAFEIEYAVGEDLDEIQYEIMISYEYKGERCICDNKNGVLQLSPPPRRYYLPDYNLSTIRKFMVDERGEVISGYDNILFGRNIEKTRIKQTFQGSFEGYKDTLIRGVRRAGKTSLLNYMLVYINSFCIDVVSVYVDCQGGTASQFIQSVFIDITCDKLERSVPELTQSNEWTEFRKAWKLTETERDRNPRLLENFYWELSRRLDGKKLVLILDEVDTLFEKVSKEQGLDTNLFPVLGAILCSMEMSQIVHFVFCGSNNLIKYSMDGGVLNQFFQRFGNVIEVGRLPVQDMNTMLEQSCGEKSEIVYTKEALDWIWRLTGGLVWYSKALGQEVLKRARNENRNVIYPSDICLGINSIASDDYCRQFIEGCGQIECKVIDAFQSLVDHENEYVPLESIIVLLTGQYERGAIEQSINLLIKLDIFEKSTLDGKEVFKYSLDLYRRYFKNRIPDGNRQQQADSLFRYMYTRKKKY